MTAPNTGTSAAGGVMDSPLLRTIMGLLALTPIVLPKVDPALVAQAGQVVVSGAGLVGLIGSLISTFRHGQRSAT